MVFNEALGFVLEREGGFVQNVKDRGGPTNKGITQSTYDLYRVKYFGSTRSVEDLTYGEAKDCYYRFYWLPGHCEELSEILSKAHFDACVNHGTRQAIKFLQKALGMKPDGIWGPDTLAKVNAKGPRITCILYIGIRAEFYFSLVERDESQEVFLKGWMNRLTELKKYLGLENNA